MHNKLLINIGFYLLLIFAFSVSIFPPVAYAAAAGLMVLWMMDLLIFREPEFTDMPLYYPILGFLAIFLVSWIVARLYGSYNDFIYLALLSIFYFIVPGFVVTNEQRRMVLWTFAAGILLYSGTKLVIFWSSLTQPGRESIEIGNSHIALITLAVCVLIAFFAESRGLFERLFQAFVCLPLIILILAAKDGNN